MSATTDDKAYIRFDRENQPGISNLLEILALLRSVSRDEVIKELEGQTQYGDFKKVVAGEMEQFLTSFQARLQSVSDDVILAKLTASENTMRAVADKTLLRVQKAVGLRAKDA